MNKHIIVVGAGIAGLTAGIYARRCGFDVTMIEQHSIVGGMCTSWKRKGYLFEGAMHWLTGSKPGSGIHQIWLDTGALADGVDISLDDPFTGVEYNGETVYLYRDIEKTTAGLLRLSPEDAPLIRRLVKEVKALSKMDMPIFDVKGVKTKNLQKMSLGFLFKILPALPTMGRTSNISVKEYIAQFSHPAIRQLLQVVPGEYQASSLLFTLATLYKGDGGHPAGGSLPFVKRMEKTFRDLGGTLLLKSKVDKVMIQNGTVTGVWLADRVLNANTVIVTQETIAANNALFDVPLQAPWLNFICKNAKSTIFNCVCLGVKAKLPAVIPTWTLKTPIFYAGKTITTLSFHSYSGHGYAPEGCTALTTGFLDDTYDFWRQAKEEGRYAAEKEALGVQVVAALNEKYPETTGRVEIIDVATPLTYERYTGAYRGAWMTPIGTGEKMQNYLGIVDNVQGLYFAGHRLRPPGGLPAAAASGRDAIQLVCKQYGATFYSN